MAYGDVTYSLGWDTLGWDTFPWGGFAYTDQDLNPGSTTYTDVDASSSVAWTLSTASRTIWS